MSEGIGSRAKAQALASDLHPQLASPLLAVWPWAGSSPSPCLSTLICKMRTVITAAPTGYWGPGDVITVNTFRNLGESAH